MLNYMNEEMNMTFTENGAVTHGSTGSDCLDLFATIGALRKAAEEEVITRFIRAYVEDSNLAMKILFFARDIRGGLGERKVFRTIFRWIALNEPNSVRKNIEYVAEYGRFDDLMILMNTPCETDMLVYLRKQFEADIEALEQGGDVSLMAKWLPSVNASNTQTRRNAKLLAKAFGISEASYRKHLSALRAKIRIIENNLRKMDYTFDYSKQPSRAMFKYRKAFLRNDTDRYKDFVLKTIKGEVKMHADNVAPYELIDPYLDSRFFFGHDGYMRDITPDEKQILNATWETMPDFGGDENAIAVIDTSGSMYFQNNPKPASVALSLGLYFAEHNKGVFKNCFIEFSRYPRLIRIKGETFVDKLRYISTFNEVANTNLEAVFNMILKIAVNNKVSLDELPAKLIIISDMEFDACVNNATATVFDNASRKYAKYGYILPQIVFWNVASRNRQQPVKMNEQGVALVSGVTPRLFSMIAGGQLSPIKFMMEVLEGERYAKIVA